MLHDRPVELHTTKADTKSDWEYGGNGHIDGSNPYSAGLWTMYKVVGWLPIELGSQLSERKSRESKVSMAG